MNKADEIDFDRIYWLVKFNYTAFIHSVWVDNSTAEELGKTKAANFMKKNNLDTYEDYIEYQNKR